VAVALLVLGVPIIDAFWIIVRRLAARRSPFAPDRGHIHHRLLDLGLSTAPRYLSYYGVCVMLALLSLRLSGTGQIYAFMGLVMVFGVALLLIERLSDTGADAPVPPDRAASRRPISRSNPRPPSRSSRQRRLSGPATG